MRRIIWVIVLILFIIPGTFGIILAGTAIDSLGNKITVPDKNLRIVSLSPGSTEILFAIGIRDELVGISDFCNYPPDLIKTKPRMGGFSTPNIEKIESVHPHVVILTTVVPIQVEKQLNRLGIKIFVSEPKSINQLMDNIYQIGKLTNHLENAQKLIENMKERIGRVVKRIHERSVHPVKTFIEIWYNPIYAAEKTTLPGDIVTKAGGEVVPDTGKDYPQLNEETLLELDPEAIILGHKISMDEFKKVHKNVSSITAIRNNKILIPNPDIFLRPGPRVINALEEVAKFLHPEAF